jgi:cardiolipin synthase
MEYRTPGTISWHSVPGTHQRRDTSQLMPPSVEHTPEPTEQASGSSHRMPRLTIAPLWKIAVRIGGLFVLLQAIVIGILLLSHRLRKRRVPAEGFPHYDPPPRQIDDTMVRIYTEGTQLYDDMLRAIAEARHTIFFETYIWKSDPLGQRFKDALSERAHAGVQVYIIYDTLANMVVPRAFKQFAAPMHVLPYRAWKRPLHALDIRRYGRDHRKTLVVDQEHGFSGGYNIGETYRTEWRDTHLGLRGTAADDLAYAFVDFWNIHRDPDVHPEITLPLRPWSPVIRVHRNDPPRMSFPIRAMYLEAIEHAQKRILLTNAYFVPDEHILDALLRTARRGVEVCILLPWQSNHVVVDWLARHYFEPCLRSGIRLFGYQGGMIHAKTATIDGIWTFIGTANLDRLSLAGNYEINTEIFDPRVAQEMEAIFERDKTNAFELHLHEWTSRPWYARVGEGVLAPLWPLV